MTNYTDAPELKASILGKTTDYAQQYDASLLYPIARKLNRDQISVDEADLPFLGEDTWTGYELSWLNAKGKPQVAVATFTFPCQSSHIVESKSFKLYLNSFNQTRFADQKTVVDTLTKDLSAVTHSQVEVVLYKANDHDCIAFTSMPGQCIDDLDIEVEHYSPIGNILKQKSSDVVSETLHSHLLKSNCLITSQPDWATIIIEYTGVAVCHESLLRYLISFRSHNEFHEQCVERIYCELQRTFAFEKLAVYARYTRRGGLDINPYRSSDYNKTPYAIRTNRQ